LSPPAVIRKMTCVCRKLRFGRLNEQFPQKD
jgi:hypothetical protein